MSFLGGSTNSLGRPNTKLFGMDNSETATHQEARPIPYLAGNRRLSVTWLSDALNIRAKKTKGGSKGGAAKLGGGLLLGGLGSGAGAAAGNASGNSKFFADLIFAICHGPVDRFDELWMDNYLVWSGPVTRGPEDFFTITINKRGSTAQQMRLYWGTETQPVDAILGATPPNIGKFARSVFNHPPYLGLCYGVIEQAALGTGRPAAPQIEVTVGRWPQPAGLTDTPLISNDINAMAVFLEWWTNPRFGLGLSTDLLDLTALNAVATAITNAGFGLSPFVDRQQPARQMFTELLQYFNGWLRTNAGQLQLGVDSPPADPSVLPVLDESDLTEEPDLKPDGWLQTFNRTNVTYSNRLRYWKESAVSWIDNANLQITGAPIEQTLARTWITVAYVARLAAAAAGQVAGIPSVNGSLKALRSAVTTLFPGDLVKLAYADYVASMILRISEKNLGAAESAIVDLTFSEDRSKEMSVLYVSPDEVWAQEQDLESEAIPGAQELMLELPRNLIDDYKITLSPLAAPADLVSDGYNIWRSPTGGGNYKQIGADPNFCLYGVLAAPYPANTLVIDDFVTMLVDMDPYSADDLLAVAEEDAIIEDTLVFIDGEILSLRDVTPVSALRYKLTGLVRAREDTVRASHSAGSSVFIISAAALVWLRRGYFSNGSTHVFEFQPSVAGVPVDFSTLVPLSAYTVTARSKRPLPPINVLIAGSTVAAGPGFPGTIPVFNSGDDITFAWRLSSWDRPLYGDWFTMWGNPYEDSKVKTYIEIWAATGSPTKPVRKITLSDGVESAIYTNAHLVADFGSEPASFLAKIWSNRSGYLSAREQDFEVTKL